VFFLTKSSEKRRFFHANGYLRIMFAPCPRHASAMQNFFDNFIFFKTSNIFDVFIANNPFLLLSLRK